MKPPYSVSHGTLRTVDLIESFLGELELWDRAKFKELHAEVPFDAWDSQDNEWWDSEDASYFLNEDLFDALNNVAPEGFYFGAHEGDGSDFGFWPIDDNV